jgi:hypothetical protein
VETFTGRCHCGNIELGFRTALDPTTVAPRACQCSFCVRHGACYVSDPAGDVEIVAHDEAALVRYRFALATADFLFCGRCGVYVGAVTTADGRSFAALNVNTFDQRGRFTLDARAVEYDGEDPATRRTRQQARWTPAVITAGTTGRRRGEASGPKSR